MKKILFAFAFFLGVFMFGHVVVAQNLGGGLLDKAAVKAGYSANTTETSFSELLGSVVRAALSFVGVIFMILMVYAGYLWMNARGDEGKVDKAQEIIRAAIIGFIITMGAYGITSYVIPAIVQRTTGGSSYQGNNDTTLGTCAWMEEMSGGTRGDVPRNECFSLCQSILPGGSCEFNGQPITE